MRRQVSLIAITAAATAALAAAPAIANAPIHKIYDCYTNGGASGLSYVQAVELRTSHEYLVAPFRKGDHLSGPPAEGRYTASGNHITWLTGPYRHHLAIFHPRTGQEGAYLEIDQANGEWTGVSCYPH